MAKAFQLIGSFVGLLLKLMKGFVKKKRVRFKHGPPNSLNERKGSEREVLIDVAIDRSNTD